MKHLFFADMRELKWALLWVSVVMIVLTFIGYHGNWGMYHAASPQFMWTALPIIGAYMPLAVLLVSSSEHSRVPRIATFACLPLSRVQLGLSRYLAPLFILAVAILTAWLAISSEHLFNSWRYASDSANFQLAFRSILDTMKIGCAILPVQLLVGTAAMSIPLIADDLWPQARTKSYGIIATIAGSFIIAEVGSFSVQGLWFERLPWMLAAAILLVGLETLLFCRRRSMV